MSQLLVNVEADRTLENTSTISNSVINYTGTEHNSIKGVHPPLNPQYSSKTTQNHSRNRNKESKISIGIKTEMTI